MRNLTIVCNHRSSLLSRGNHTILVLENVIRLKFSFTTKIINWLEVYTVPKVVIYWVWVYIWITIFHKYAIFIVSNIILFYAGFVVTFYFYTTALVSSNFTFFDHRLAFKTVADNSKVCVICDFTIKHMYDVLVFIPQHYSTASMSINLAIFQSEISIVKVHA